MAGIAAPPRPVSPAQILRFHRSPYHGQFYPSRLGVLPLSEAAEFAESELFEHACVAPVLIDPRQRLRLLAEIATGAFVGLPWLDLVFANICAPDYLAQLPAALLDRRVLLCSDPLAMAALTTPGVGWLAIAQSLRTDGYERGDNAIALTFGGGGDVATSMAFVARLAARFGCSREDSHAE